MSRAMFLPTPGDPYIALGWLSSYKKFCMEAVDKLYVNINSPAPKEVVDYIEEEFKKVGACVVRHNKFIGHGHALTELLDLCKEDHVFISEDDFYIQQQGMIDKWFKIIENKEKDLIVSMRGSVHPSLIKATAIKYSLFNKEAIEPNFWPSLFVARTKDLRKTDKNFEAKVFKNGEYIKEINYTPSEDMSGDTFVWMSMQLRHMGLKYQKELQWRMINVIRRWVSTPPWIHVGSGSTSFNGHLFNKDMTMFGNERELLPREITPLPNKGIKDHFEWKYAWWKMMKEAFPIPESSPLFKFGENYGRAIERTTRLYNLNQNFIDHHERAYFTILSPILN